MGRESATFDAAAGSSAISCPPTAIGPISVPFCFAWQRPRPSFEESRRRVRRRDRSASAVHSSPMTAQRPWWQTPTVILAHAYEFQPTVERGPAAIERAVRWKRNRGFDAEHLMVNHSMFEGSGGDDSRAYCFKNFHGYREDYL